MTDKEFNKKYEHLLESYKNNGKVLQCNGLSFNDPDVIEFLDEIFETVCSKMKGFKFYQISIIFGKCRFYSNVQGYQFEVMIEQKIDELLKEKLTE
jgi:hypothetical protein